MDDSNSGNSDESARGAAAQESSVKKKIILVEYPGLVNNVDKCLKTLGGLGKLSEVRFLCLREFFPDVYNFLDLPDIRE